MELKQTLQNCKTYDSLITKQKYIKRLNNKCSELQNVKESVFIILKTAEMLLIFRKLQIMSHILYLVVIWYLWSAGATGYCEHMVPRYLNFQA